MTRFLLPRNKGERLHEQVTRLIAMSIIERGALHEEADLMTESGLSSLFTVSRSVMRESIKVLAAKGLVEVRPRIGVRVRPRSEWNLADPDLLTWQCDAGVDDALARDICEIRIILEPAAAELAALRASDEEIRTIEGCYRQMEGIGRNNSSMLHADLQFHYSILSASHNALLLQIGNTFRSAFQHALELGVRACHPMDLTLPMHRMVAEYIANRDGLGARTQMEELVRQTAQDCFEALQASQEIVRT